MLNKELLLSSNSSQYPYYNFATFGMENSSGNYNATLKVLSNCYTVLSMDCEDYHLLVSIYVQYSSGTKICVGGYRSSSTSGYDDWHKWNVTGTDTGWTIHSYNSKIGTEDWPWVYTPSGTEIIFNVDGVTQGSRSSAFCLTFSKIIHYDRTGSNHNTNDSDPYMKTSLPSNFYTYNDEVMNSFSSSSYTLSL